MSLTITLLGCGTSSGVPRIGNDWGACDPTEPKNRRTRVSMLVQSPTTCILVDTSPDMRAQLLAADVIDIDAILWTHDHADHTHGIDDVRQIFHHRRTPVPGYGRAQTIRLLGARFAYVFEGRNGYPPTIDAHILPDGLRIGDIDIACVDQPHGDIWSTGFRFSHGGRSVGYATDFHDLTPDMLALYDGLDVWVVDALREKPHPTHPHLALTLDGITAARPGRAILIHMDQSMDYATLRDTLPQGVEPGYDGMTVHLAPVEQGGGMNGGDQAASTIWYVLAIVLVGSSLIGRRLAWGGLLRMALLWVAIFAALLGLFKLAQDQGFLTGRWAARPAEEGEAAPVLPTARAEGQALRIPVSPDGHYWVEGTINGTSARFLIDSGATVTALSEQTARAAGLNYDVAEPGVIMTTANGKIEARRSSIASLAIGPINASDLPVVVSPAFGEVNVIGMNMLSRLKSWGVQNGEMVLTP